MGRKKRKMKPKERKTFDMSYGRTLTLQCVIDKSHHSDAHGVYLEIDRKRQKQYRLISVPTSILDVWKVALNGMTILESCNYSYSQTNDEITKNFIRDLVETYGDYPSDDPEYQPCGNNLVLVPWLLSGGTMNDKHIPEGITLNLPQLSVTIDSLDADIRSIQQGGQTAEAQLDTWKNNAISRIEQLKSEILATID